MVHHVRGGTRSRPSSSSSSSTSLKMTRMWAAATMLACLRFTATWGFTSFVPIIPSIRQSPKITTTTRQQMSSSTTTNDDIISKQTKTDPQKITLFNSLSREKEPFIPILPDKVSLYTCGPTLYDAAHVGNFRAFLTYDILKRTLKYFGYTVDHICNLTDVDDKIIARCDREKTSLKELTEKFEGLFMDDLASLNIVPARAYPKATDHIPEMVEMIEDLEKNNLAYQSEEGSWYFNVGLKEGYGEQLVQLDLSGMKRGGSGMAGAQRGSSTDADEYDTDKQGVRDFAMWKAYKPDFDREDATWDTRIGKGRPGWHLECSAMAKKYLGDTIDLHCGGIDLKFPHHENEIAQSEGASNKKFCNCWLHNGFVNIGSEKMSKSKGNFLTLRTACPKPMDVRAYRYLIVSSQYRNPLSFTDAAMSGAKSALTRMDSIRKQLEEQIGEQNEKGDVAEPNEMSLEVDKLMVNFDLAIADDLSMPRAAACLFGVVKLAEAEFKRVKKINKDETVDTAPSLDSVGLRAVYDALNQMDQVFGVFYSVPTSQGSGDGAETSDEDDEKELTVPQEVLDLVEQRTAAKNDKDWAMADSFRDRIAELGFTVKDKKGGDPIVTRV